MTNREPRPAPPLGLHKTTFAVLGVSAPILLAQQWVIGPFYWSGLPLLINLLYGAIILCTLGLAVEWRMRRAGTLFRFRLRTGIAMMLAAALLTGMTFLAWGPSYDYIGNKVYFYGLTSPVVEEVHHRTRDANGEWHETHVTWSYSSRDILENVAFVLFALLTVGLLGERLLYRKPAATAQDERPDF